MTYKHISDEPAAASLASTDVFAIDTVAGPATKKVTASQIGTFVGLTYVPYTGATGAVNLGSFGITLASLIATSATINTVAYFNSSKTLTSVAAATAQGMLLRAGTSGIPEWTGITFPNSASTAGQLVRAGGSSNLVMSTATFADTFAANRLLHASSSNVVEGLATANNGVLITSVSGVPSISSTLPSAVQSNITSLGTIASGVWNGTAISLTSYASGTLQAAQFPALTSDVTTSAGSLATTIAANAVTYAKMQAVSTTSKLLGSSSTTTPVQEITVGSGLSLSGTTLTSTGLGGTVTTVSVVSANGFAGTVATATSTPAITLTTTITGILSGNGTAISAASTTGSGSVVLATSPTLVTPLLGTPTSGVLTNCTGLPLTTGVTGILPLANGGTNASITAANGAVVYSTGSALGVTTAPGATGKILLSTNAGSPTWSSAIYLQGDGGGGNSDIYITNYATRVTTNGINVFIGHACGNATLTSTRTTAIGSNAGFSLTSGAGNSFFGNICGYGVTTGGSNALYGAFVGQTAAAAAMDSSAIFGSSACANGSASQAAIFGGSAAIAATGVGNCVFGYFSGYGLTGGTYNIFLGYQAGRGVTSGSSNILIGYMAGRSYVTTQSNQLYICNSDTATPLIGGVFPNVSLTFTAGTTTCSAAFVAGASGFSVGATGTVTAGLWNGSIIGLAYGGTNANLTASNGGIVWSNATQLQILAGTATAGKILQSGATATPSWSTPTYPSASGTAGKVLRADGTNNVYSTSTFADTYAVSTILYASSANAVAGLATANSAVLITSGSGIPSLATTLPNINIGTPTSGVLTSCTGLPMTTGVTGILPIANGGTNTGSQTTNGVTYYSGSAITSGSSLTTDGTGRLGIGGATDSTITLYISKAVTAGSGSLLQQQIGGALGATASNTLSAATYLYLYPNFSVNAGIISDAYGLLVGTGAAGATITRGYGIFVSNIAYGTTRYGLYIAAQSGGTTNVCGYFGGPVQMAASGTGSTTALLATANCPATTGTSPYVWIKFLSSDGSTVYVPAWK